MQIGLPELIVIAVVICLLLLLVVGGSGMVIWFITHKHRQDEP
jgi:hypothetical protein